MWQSRSSQKGCHFHGLPGSRHSNVRIGESPNMDSKDLLKLRCPDRASQRLRQRRRIFNEACHFNGRLNHAQGFLAGMHLTSREWMDLQPCALQIPYTTAMYVLAAPLALPGCAVTGFLVVYLQNGQKITDSAVPRRFRDGGGTNTCETCLGANPLPSPSTLLRAPSTWLNIQTKAPKSCARPALLLVFQSRGRCSAEVRIPSILASAGTERAAGKDPRKQKLLYLRTVRRIP